MRSDLAAGAILLALAGYIFLTAGAMPFGTARVPQTAFFPKCLAILLGVLALILLGRAFIGIKDTLRLRRNRGPRLASHRSPHWRC